MHLAHGLENNDNMVRHDLPVSMVIEGSLYSTKLYFLPKMMLQCSIDNHTILYTRMETINLSIKILA